MLFSYLANQPPPYNQVSKTSQVVTVVIPPDPVVMSPVCTKLIAVSDVPTEVPFDFTSIPDTTPDNSLPSPINLVAVTTEELQKHKTYKHNLKLWNE